MLIISFIWISSKSPNFLAKAFAKFFALSLRPFKSNFNVSFEFAATLLTSAATPPLRL